MIYSQAAIDRAKLLLANEKMPGATQSALDFAKETLAVFKGFPLQEKFWNEIVEILSEKNLESRLSASEERGKELKPGEIKCPDCKGTGEGFKNDRVHTHAVCMACIGKGKIKDRRAPTPDTRLREAKP